MSEIVEKVLAGDIRTVSRLISNIDDGVPGVRQIMKEIYPHTGNAYIIGITGAPGVGKSTLVDKMLSHLRKQGKSVGIIAVDPTSPFSGGAILGDRIRMQRHSSDNGVFIRSLATRGHFGGLTQSTHSAIEVLDAMGKDFIIVETVGVGQDEVDIVKNSHTTVIVLIPGMGDDIQSIKAGILEIGDIFVINKSDREGADKTLNDLRSMIEMGSGGGEKKGWKQPILMTEAVTDKGVDRLLEEIMNHRNTLFDSEEGSVLRRDRERIIDELEGMIKSRLIEVFFSRIKESGRFERAAEAISDGLSDPYSASDELIREILNGS